tara:strand:- start:118 stop:237 length:120 start_codon:yes stop_codon:yes gene_type:complete
MMCLDETNDDGVNIRMIEKKRREKGKIKDQSYPLKPGAK